MTIKNYLIVDDSAPDSAHLTNLLDPFPGYRLAGVAATVEEALDLMVAQPIDLLFLDIRLSGQSGFTLLRAGVALPPIIITSAYPEYALESYEAGPCADYLLKPFTPERLHLSVTRAMGAAQPLPRTPDPQAVFLKMGRKIQHFDHDAIDYIKADGIYSKVYSGKQMSLVNGRLTALEQALPPQVFVRVHKSYMINMTKITSYDRHYFYLADTKVPIGISHRPKLQPLLSLFDGFEE